MSPTRSGYRELGLKLVSFDEKKYLQPKWPLMLEEKRNEGVEDPIKRFLMESLMQQRNEMLDSSPCCRPNTHLQI
jgi:hypothetical protein